MGLCEANGIGTESTGLKLYEYGVKAVRVHKDNCPSTVLVIHRH